MSPAGYRLYTKEDLERLQQVLFFRKLGFSLQEIKEIVNSPGFDRKRALRSHRKLLLEQKKRLERLIESMVECSPEIFRGLGELYVQDSRFAAFYEKMKPGMAEFMRRAMGVYADRLEGKG